MITYDTLLIEMEKHILLAKKTNNPQQLREHLSAIRALCDVGLLQNTEVKEIQNIPNSSSKSIKLDEDEGNGTSIFDF